MKEYKGPPALDAGLLAAAQAVEHYEISRYGTLRSGRGAWTTPPPPGCSTPRLKEEKNTDAALSKLAESEVNLHAQQAEAA